MMARGFSWLIELLVALTMTLAIAGGARRLSCRRHARLSIACLANLDLQQRGRTAIDVLSHGAQVGRQECRCNGRPWGR